LIARGINSNLKFIVVILTLRILLFSPFLMGIHSHFVFFHSKMICLDKMSRFLIVLTLWITLLMRLSMNKALNLWKLIFSFLALNLILILSFSRNRLLGFYIFFELSLIPTLVIILGWGVQPERVRAGRYLMIYTLVGSLPLLGTILYMDFHCGSVKTFLPLIKIFFFSGKDYRFFCFLWIIAFLIKLPIYGVHLWLPKAHVEAPVAGSMVLAGILLKLGAYGLIRSLHFLEIKICFWTDFFFTWRVVRMCLVGFMCFRQCDLKSLVAYSSVAHMSLIFAARFSLDLIGAKGIMGILISHGLCSSGLFFGVQCLYENRGSRSLYLNRGLISLSPLFCFFWFLLCVGKASAPPSLNLLREFFLIARIVRFGEILRGIFCGLSVFIGGLFSIYLYTLVSHGKWSVINNFWIPFSLRHFLILFLHMFPLYGLIFLRKFIFFI